MIINVLIETLGETKIHKDNERITKKMKNFSRYEKYLSETKVLDFRNLLEGADKLFYIFLFT